MLKLRVELREGKVIAGDFGAPDSGDGSVCPDGDGARELATAQATARNRWRKEATPAGHDSI